MENTYHVFKNSVTVHVNGKTATISKDDVRYAQIMKVILENNLSAIGGILENAECVDRLESILDLN